MFSNFNNLTLYNTFEIFDTFPLNTSQSENSQMQFIHEHVIVTRPAPIENRDSKRMKI